LLICWKVCMCKISTNLTSFIAIYFRVHFLSGHSVEIITNLISAASWYVIIEERFVEEQGTFTVIALVIEVFASCHMQTFQRALALVRVLYGVRCVGATHSSVRVVCLTYLGCRHDCKDQLGY